MQHIAVYCRILRSLLPHIAVCCRVLRITKIATDSITVSVTQREREAARTRAHNAESPDLACGVERHGPLAVGLRAGSKCSCPFNSIQVRGRPRPFRAAMQCQPPRPQPRHRLGGSESKRDHRCQTGPLPTRPRRRASPGSESRVDKSLSEAVEVVCRLATRGRTSEPLLGTSRQPQLVAATSRGPAGSQGVVRAGIPHSCV